MKFSLVPVGQGFRYQGQTYHKVSPLMASAEDGKNQRLIPRSAEVEPLGEVAAPPRAPEQLPTAQVDQAMQTLAGDINNIVSDSGLDAETVNALLRQLQVAFMQCRRNLNLS